MRACVQHLCSGAVDRQHLQIAKYKPVFATITPTKRFVITISDTHRSSPAPPQPAEDKRTEHGYECNTKEAASQQSQDQAQAAAGSRETWE